MPNDYDKLMDAAVRLDDAVKTFVRETATLALPLHVVVDYVPGQVINRLPLAALVAFERNKREIPKP
jgi:hypothetical protein